MVGIHDGNGAWVRVWMHISHKPGVVVLSDSRQQLLRETVSPKKTEGGAGE